MDFITVCKTLDLATIPRKTVGVLGKRLLLRRMEDGSYDCIEIQCKHQGADMSQGKITGDIVTCPRHGWQYNLRTGACLNNHSNPLRRHEVKVVGQDIQVSIKPLESEEG